MFDGFVDPNPKITAALKESLLGGKRRIEIVEMMLKRKVAEEITDDPPYYVITLNHYGGQAFITKKGTIFGHVYEYNQDSEITGDDRALIDIKLQKLHPDYFFAPMNDEQRQRGAKMVIKDAELIKGELPSFINIRFPDAEMVQINLENGSVRRHYSGCFWRHECPDKKLPVMMLYQVDRQLGMMADLTDKFTTDLYNQMIGFQAEVIRTWTEIKNTVRKSLPDDYWKLWTARSKCSLPMKEGIACD